MFIFPFFTPCRSNTILSKEESAKDEIVSFGHQDESKHYRNNIVETYIKKKNAVIHRRRMVVFAKNTKSIEKLKGFVRLSHSVRYSRITLYTSRNLFQTAGENFAKIRSVKKERRGVLINPRIPGPRRKVAEGKNLQLAERGAIFPLGSFMHSRSLNRNGRFIVAHVG